MCILKWSNGLRKHFQFLPKIEFLGIFSNIEIWGQNRPLHPWNPYLMLDFLETFIQCVSWCDLIVHGPPVGPWGPPVETRGPLYCLPWIKCVPPMWWVPISSLVSQWISSNYEPSVHPGVIQLLTKYFANYLENSNLAKYRNVKFSKKCPLNFQFLPKTRTLDKFKTVTFSIKKIHITQWISTKPASNYLQRTPGDIQQTPGDLQQTSRGPLGISSGPLGTSCGPQGTSSGPLRTSSGPQGTSRAPLTDLRGPPVDHWGPPAETRGPLWWLFWIKCVPVMWWDPIPCLFYM